MPVQELILVLLIGLGAGMLSGLVGIGGGVIMVPALVFFLHYNQHQAQGTSLAVLTLPVVILASYTYYRECQKMGHPIDLRIAGLLAFTFVIGAYAGSQVAVKIHQETLRKIFAAVLIYTAIKMLKWDEWLMAWMKRFF